MSHYHYQETFKALYDKSIKLFKEGNSNKDTYFDQSELEFIAANGLRVQDFFDYAEDAYHWGDPSYEIAQSIEQVRREYFLHVQKGVQSESRISAADLPAKTESLEGINWLPRIIPKAIGKLKGELPDEVMYSCGGDRHFLSSNDIHPAEFLRVVWANLDNTQAVIDFVKSRSQIASV